ncbi:MAG: asparagine--tRNA ligase, partial [Bacteroidales bacterium]|nr:asparagine--tRNA ligase [Bacteroidales bacterium]
MRRTEIKSLLQSRDYGNEVLVQGWVRTKRGSKNVSFIALNDGSTINNVQIVVDVDDNSAAILEKVNTGAALSVVGELVESAGSGQKVEVHAKNIEVLG